MRTYKEVLEDGIQLLETAAIEEARLDAWLLLEYGRYYKSMVLCTYG